MMQYRQTLLAITIALIHIPAMTLAMENRLQQPSVETKRTAEGATISLRSTAQTDTYTLAEWDAVTTVIRNKPSNGYTGNISYTEQFDDGEFAPERTSFEPQEAETKFAALQNLFNNTPAQ